MRKETKARGMLGETYSLASEQNPDPTVLKCLLTCIQEEYGKSYIDGRIYDMDWLMEETRAGRLLTAVTFAEKGEAAACLCLRENPPFYGVGDLCMHVVRKAYRGGGIGTALVDWMIRRPETRRFSAIGAHNATFHALSQRESYLCGLRPCGMLMNLYISQGFAHTCPNVGDKLSYAISTMPLEYQKLSLYLPEEHRAFAEKYYGSVGVPVRFMEGGEPDSSSDLTIMENEEHRTLMLCLKSCGLDLEAQISELLSLSAEKPMQTVNACLELSHPSAAWGYRILKNLGFHFSGLQPFCRGKQYLLLHHPLGVDIPFDEMHIDPAYQAMFDDVRIFFDREGKVNEKHSK